LEVGRELLRLTHRLEAVFNYAITPRNIQRKIALEMGIGDPEVESIDVGIATLAVYDSVCDEMLDCCEKLKTSLQEAATIWGEEPLEWAEHLENLAKEFGTFTAYQVSSRFGPKSHNNVLSGALVDKREVVEVQFGPLPISANDDRPKENDFKGELDSEIRRLKQKIREKMQLPN